MYTYPGLFQRVETVYESRHEYSLGDEDIRLIERVYLDFVRAGAKLDEKAQTRYKEISTELAVLTTQFAQNVTADETAFTLPLDPEKKEDLEGLPDFLVEAAKQAAMERGLPGAVITLSRSLIEPFLTFSARRDLREKSW